MVVLQLFQFLIRVSFPPRDVRRAFLPRSFSLSSCLCFIKLAPPVHPLSLSFACVAMDGSRTPLSDPDPAAIGKDDLEYEASLWSLLKQEKAARSAAAGSGAPTVVAAPVDPWEVGRLLSPDLASMGSPPPHAVPTVPGAGGRSPSSGFAGGSSGRGGYGFYGGRGFFRGG